MTITELLKTGLIPDTFYIHQMLDEDCKYFYTVNFQFLTESNYIDLTTRRGLIRMYKTMTACFSDLDKIAVRCKPWSLSIQYFAYSGLDNKYNNLGDL